MAAQLTASQQRWVELAAMHADDFATRAAEHDREGSFPFENFEAMKTSGYTNMPIPEELGGGGASLLDMCLAQERLARGDGATALAVNMHLGLPWIMADNWRGGDESARPLLEQIAEKKLITFGSNTDPNVDSLLGGTGMGYTTVKAQRTDGGFIISGRKAFGTNSPIGDLFGSSAIYEDPTEGEVSLLFMIPKDTPGLICQNDWDTMGMRSSCSHSWVFDHVFVPEDVVIRRKPWEWDHYLRGLFAWHGGTYCAVYLGIARAARDFAVEYAKRTTKVPFQYPESYHPGTQFLVAEMDISLKAAWTFQVQIAERLSDPKARDDETLVDAFSAQYFGMKMAVDVVDKAMEMAGGAALARRLPLERYYRDVRAGPIHPLAGYHALEVIGKHALGIPRDSSPRWV